MPRPKKIDDLPHLLVAEVKEDGVDSDGYVQLNLLGVFDRLDGVRRGRCWLLLPEQQGLISELTSLDPKTKAGNCRTWMKTVPALVGRGFPYLDAYWQAYHVWMVTDENQSWQEIIFQASDAVSDTLEGSDGQKLRHLRRVTAQDLDDRELTIVPNGWDHEHCEFCNSHIDPGDLCRRDNMDRWVCVRCYDRYVKTHDLSFIDDL
jgi:hypothetical protein